MAARHNFGGASARGNGDAINRSLGQQKGVLPASASPAATPIGSPSAEPRGLRKKKRERALERIKRKLHRPKFEKWGQKQSLEIDPKVLELMRQHRDIRMKSNWKNCWQGGNPKQVLATSAFLDIILYVTKHLWVVLFVANRSLTQWLLVQARISRSQMLESMREDHYLASLVCRMFPYYWVGSVLTVAVFSLCRTLQYVRHPGGYTYDNLIFWVAMRLGYDFNILIGYSFGLWYTCTHNIFALFVVFAAVYAVMHIFQWLLQGYLEQTASLIGPAVVKSTRKDQKPIMGGGHYSGLRSAPLPSMATGNLWDEIAGHEEDRGRNEPHHAWVERSFHLRADEDAYMYGLGTEEERNRVRELLRESHEQDVGLYGEEMGAAASRAIGQHFLRAEHETRRRESEEEPSCQGTPSKRQARGAAALAGVRYGTTLNTGAMPKMQP